MKWMPIETAPKDGSVFLAFDYADGFEDWSIVNTWWNSNKNCWDNPYMIAEFPTHWMPLPPAPEMKP